MSHFPGHVRPEADFRVREQERHESLWPEGSAALQKGKGTFQEGGRPQDAFGTRTEGGTAAEAGERQ